MKLSNQELSESKEMYINYFNNNGMYNDFYGGLILLHGYRGSLEEQSNA